MGLEIERKFLVYGEDWRMDQGVHFRQGYLNRDPQRTVRVRTAGGRAFLTIKGASVGAMRLEFEYEIPVAHGEELLKICVGPLIEKIRRVISYQGSRWEVDEFLGANEGLVIAEIELAAVEEEFARPPWLGREVTDDPRYFNVSLTNHPFCDWPKK